MSVAATIRDAAAGNVRAQSGMRASAGTGLPSSRISSSSPVLWSNHIGVHSQAYPPPSGLTGPGLIGLVDGAVDPEETAEPDQAEAAGQLVGHSHQGDPGGRGHRERSEE